MNPEGRLKLIEIFKKAGREQGLVGLKPIAILKGTVFKGNRAWLIRSQLQREQGLVGLKPIAILKGRENIKECIVTKGIA